MKKFRFERTPSGQLREFAGFGSPPGGRRFGETLTSSSDARRALTAARVTIRPEGQGRPRVPGSIPLEPAPVRFYIAAVEIIAHSLTLVTGYLLGSLPTGYLAGMALGVDLRDQGSGNMGATNAFRVLGKTIGLLVLLVDLLKGLLACLLIPRGVLTLLGGSAAVSGWNPEVLQILAGIAAILGHNYTCWLRFRGGKGIATTAGVMGALVPVSFAIILGVWLLVFTFTRYVSLASMIAAAILPVSVWLLGRSPLMVGVALFMGAMAIYKHRTNIQRLLAGTEHRFGKKKSSATRSFNA